MRATTLLLLLALALAASGCLSKSASPPQSPPANDSATSNNVTRAPMAFTVTVGGGVCPGAAPPMQPGTSNVYSLAPAKLQFTLGTRVNLTLKNDGCAPHDLVIEGIEGAQIGNVAAGKTASVEFAVTKAGTFAMYCTLGGGPTSPATAHKDHGMSGSVTVA